MKSLIFMFSIATFLLSSAFVPGVSQNKDFEILSEEEKIGLTLLREEEKLAQEVYTVLYAKWNHPVFNNIMQSEERHGERIKGLLTKYQLKDPFIAVEGQYASIELQTLYHILVKKGSTSLLEAFEVGAMIEDLDISDLDRLSSSTHNSDLIEVYNILNKGSQNHLRAFAKQLNQRNIIYTPQYINQERWEEILSDDSKKVAKKTQNSFGSDTKSCAGSVKGKSCHKNSDKSFGSTDKTLCKTSQGSCHKNSETKSCHK